jgi:hypothetical protein
MSSNNEKLAIRYLEWISTNYNELQLHLKKYCSNQRYKWDEDVFSQTYLNVYERIQKKGLEDPTEQGFLNFTFISFKFNTIRASQYCSVKKRIDKNDDEINKMYEDYYNANNDTSDVKVMRDLKTDFSALYLAQKAEENCEVENYRLWKMKMFMNLTYKQLAEKTGDKQSRQKVLQVKNWLKEHISKKEIDKAFDDFLERNHL